MLQPLRRGERVQHGEIGMGGRLRCQVVTVHLRRMAVSLTQRCALLSAAIVQPSTVKISEFKVLPCISGDGLLHSAAAVHRRSALVLGLGSSCCVCAGVSACARLIKDAAEGTHARGEDTSPGDL